mmetsp:Transcript_31968/g.37261  ORF Transcript_31968/g.37261 Transcript_31968/m.37261 type:complete len:100 (-) Transcript_31968:124-423(-)
MATILGNETATLSASKCSSSCTRRKGKYASIDATWKERQIITKDATRTSHNEAKDSSVTDAAIPVYISGNNRTLKLNLDSILIELYGRKGRFFGSFTEI